MKPSPLHALDRAAACLAGALAALIWGLMVAPAIVAFATRMPG